MFGLGMLYDDDEYCGKNKEKSIEWLKKASETGNEDVQKLVEKWKAGTDCESQ